MIRPVRIVFFGTPAFAVPTLDALAASGRTPLLVVTQPPRPVGRGLELAQPPVARWAVAHDVPLRQPEKLRDPTFLDALRALEPDVAVVVAFGRIFKPELLALPRLGCVNVHASLLPRWRGAAPIQAAIAAGDEETGVTTMQMEAGLDTGPMLLRSTTPIAPDETADSLAGRLAVLGGALLVRTLEGLEAGALVAQPQDDSLATHAPQLTKEDGAVRWSESAGTIAHRLRAYTPWPGLSSTLRGQPVKLLAVQAIAADQPRLAGAGDVPGTIVALPNVAGGGLRVACGDGSELWLGSLQRPGKRAVSAVDFANGERLARGEAFG
jgi:methionyl-tRNA formyltransferase